ncbi:MAG: IclR family transcriptional regulator [Hyphomicrobiaceae bacterium]|nr:IclR family transcriptional regulator [Hyphomicrobiaceae bacterium]
MVTRPLSSTLKTLAVLDLMARSRTALRLSDVARAVDASRATAYQRLHTLVEAGWVEQVPDGSYRLALHAAQVGNAALEQASLGDRVLPVLQQLMQRTGETASLAVLDDCSVVLVQRVEARGMLRADLRVGAPLSLHESASGQVLAAYAPAEVMAEIRQRGLRPPSARILARVRQEGISVAGGGPTLRGIRVAAVPIFDRAGHCLAALSVVGPESRFDLSSVEAAIRDAGAQINAMLSNGTPKRL